MTEKQNLDILNFLQHAEPASELYDCLMSYTPSQHPSAYEYHHFAEIFLTVINNMVSVVFTYLYVAGFDTSPHFIGFW